MISVTHMPKDEHIRLNWGQEARRPDHLTLKLVLCLKMCQKVGGWVSELKIQSPSKSSADPQRGSFGGKSILILAAWSECFFRNSFSSSRSLAGIPLEDSSAMTAAGFRRMHCSEHNFSLFGFRSPLSQFCSAAGRHDPWLHFGPIPPCSSRSRCMKAGIMIMMHTPTTLIP